MLFKRFAVAGAFVVAAAASAAAADLPTIPAAPPPPPAAPVAPAFNWSGPYVGVYAAGIFNPPGDPIIPVGAQAGFNFVRGSFLAGAEVYGEYRFWDVENHWSAGANARVGGVLGERLVLYGEAGVGWVSALGGFPVWTAGGGLEIGLGRNASLFTEVKAIAPFNAGPGARGIQAQAGVNFHFGN